jgi:ubiquinone/menaquinone biosynthesis C-methylase UbiE
MSNASEAFDAHAADYDKWFESPAGSAIFASEVGAIRLLMAKLEHPFLEIGVGTGRFAKELAIDAGIDPSEQALAFARKRGVEARKATGETIPFADASFGAVFVLFTLCFVEAPEKVLSEAARVLKPGGCALVGIINRESAWGSLYMQKKAEGHPIYRHARFYNTAGLSAMLKTAGLHVEGYSSSLIQPPSDNPNREEAHSGLSKEAGFICIRARKVSEGTNTKE